MEELKSSLTCCICMEIATLPVHAMCCESAKTRPPACMTCVRSYLQLNQPHHSRPYSKKSWSGCGCHLNVRQSANLIYSHTIQLDTIRNLLGPSFCPHNECNAKFATTAELRRHLNGTSRDGQESNCMFAMTRCKYCRYFGVRHDVEGQHYNENHNTVFCPICNQDIMVRYAKLHYNKHARFMQTLHKSLMDKNEINETDTPPPGIFDIPEENSG